VVRCGVLVIRICGFVRCRVCYLHLGFSVAHVLLRIGGTRLLHVSEAWIL
jgi:hypothetical protein